MLVRTLLFVFILGLTIGCSGERETSAFRQGKKRHKDSATIHMKKSEARKKFKAGKRMKKASAKKFHNQ